MVDAAMTNVSFTHTAAGSKTARDLSHQQIHAEVDCFCLFVYTGGCFSHGAQLIFTLH